MAGGIFDHEGTAPRQLRLGADGVQVATRFVTTEECDADPAYKQAYLDAEEKDIVIGKSPWQCWEGPDQPVPGKSPRRKDPGEGVLPVPGALQSGGDPVLHHPGVIDAAEGNIEEALLFSEATRTGARGSRLCRRCMRQALRRGAGGGKAKLTPALLVIKSGRRVDFYMLNYLWAGDDGPGNPVGSVPWKSGPGDQMERWIRPERR